MRALVSDWLNSPKEQITLFEGDDEILLKRQARGVLVAAQLTSAHSDTATLQRWMRLGAASLGHFQGALAQKPESGALWLIHSLRDVNTPLQLLGCLETLLNQRDTWRGVFARQAATTPLLKPTSLRSLSY